MMLVQSSAIAADPDRARQRLGGAGARRRPGALAAALALPPPAHAGGPPPRRRRRGDLLAAPRLDEPGAPRPRARRAALGLHGQRRAPGAGWRASASSSPPRSATPLPSPPPPTREAEALRARAAPPEGLAGLLADPEALARHLAWLDPPTARRPGEPDAALANALLKLADGFGPDALDARETFAVMCSPADARRASRRSGARAAEARSPQGERFLISRRPARQVRVRSCLATLPREGVTRADERFSRHDAHCDLAQHHGAGRHRRRLDGLDAAGRRRDRRRRAAGGRGDERRRRPGRADQPGGGDGARHPGGRRDGRRWAPRGRPSAPARPSRSSSAASACPRARSRCRRIRAGRRAIGTAWRSAPAS